MQKTVNIVLGLAVLSLAIAMGWLILDRSNPAPDESAIREIVADAMADTGRAAPEPDAAGADIDAAIENYLLSNPRILQDVSTALETELAAEEAATTRAALANLDDEIYDDPQNIILGNPDGDVTLVEMFDYNCTYCRQVVPDVLELIAEDPNLRVILKEFPILSAGSVEAARVGVLVNQTDVDYSVFHTDLMTARGTIDGTAALAAAAALGLDPANLEARMDEDEITGTIERSYAIAQGLGITGTPTFIIGNEIIPGAVDKADLAMRIANMRACGQTVCPAAEG